jgi:hypothetical protein
MKTSRKNILLLSSGSLLGVLIAFTAVIHLEPFAPRFESKTVNQWLNYYLVSHESPNWEVIKVFGTNAFPTLIAAEKLPLLCIWSEFLEKRFHVRVRSQARKNAMEKAYLAEFWGKTLVNQNRSIEVDLLKNNPHDEFVLKVFLLIREYKPYSFNRLDRYLFHSDAMIRDRARELFKKGNRIKRKDFKFELSSFLTEEQSAILKQPRTNLGTQLSNTAEATTPDL